MSRITVYNRFGTRARLLEALAPPSPPPAPVEGDARDLLRRHLDATCTAWAREPALFRHLPARDQDSGGIRHLAESLAAADALRPGCSIREAEDVISALTSFAVFDRLHKDGRRSPAAVGDILMRLAAGILS